MAGVAGTGIERVEGLNDPRIALLIDAENMSYSHIPAVLEEVLRFGRVGIRRAYGDWTSQQMSGWKRTLLEHSIIPVQQFRLTAGKNASDSAMIIDAMDILHREEVHIFAIVSSDSDFTRLASRLREAGKYVLGVGEGNRTPSSFRNACDRFIPVENIIGTDASGQSRPDGMTEPERAESPAELTTSTRPELLPLLLRAYDMASGDEAYVRLSRLGELLHRLNPSFDPRSYGKRKLIDLVMIHPESFEVRRDAEGNPYVFLCEKEQDTA